MTAKEALNHLRHRNFNLDASLTQHSYDGITEKDMWSLIESELDALELLKQNNSILTYSHSLTNNYTEYIIRFIFNNFGDFEKVKKVLNNE